MKTSEEKLNEALRAALKRKFDNFEAVPDPSIFSKVKSQIDSKRYWRYFLLAGLILAGFVTGTVIRSDSDVAVSHGTKTATTGKTASLPGTENLKDFRSGFKNPESKIHKNDILENSIIKNSRVRSMLAKEILPEIHGILKKDVVEYIQNPPNEIKEPQIIDGPNVNAEPKVLEFELSVLRTNKPFFRSKGMDLPNISLAKKSSSSVLPGTSSGKTNWILNVTPLQTYQILTVPSSSGSRYQNFRFPSALSVKSLGYKFSVGVEKKGVQLLLNYSGFRQFYTYEIAGSDYLVESTGTKNYNVIRKGEKVHEDKKINLLGIGVNKTFKWGNNATGKYYFVTGLEYSHSVNSRQDIGWVNAGFGKQFAAGRNMLINLGPYAEFSPLKTSGARDPFFYQPYRVGFSLGLKFGKP